jgi:hypothetical protein
MTGWALVGEQHVMVGLCGRVKLLTSWPGSKREEDEWARTPWVRVSLEGTPPVT